MKVISILTIVTLVYYLYLFYLAVKNLKRSLSHRLLLFSLLSLIFLSVLSFFTYNAENIKQIRILMPVSMIGLFFYFPLNSLFVYSLNPKKQVSILYCLVLLAPALFFSVINFFIPVGFKDFIKHPDGWEFVPNLGHPLNTVWLIYACLTFFLIVFILLYRIISDGKKEGRKQYIVLLITSVITILSLFLEYTLDPFLRNIRPASVSPILMSVWITGMFLSVKRHRLLDIFPDDTAREILHSLDEHIILVGFDGIVQYLNKTAELFFKEIHYKAFGKNITEIFIDENGENIGEILKPDTAPQKTHQLFICVDSDRKPGSVFDMKINIVCDRRDNPRGFVFRGRLRQDYSILGKEYSLTEREREVAYLVSRNFKNKAIGEYMNITERTVKAHLTSIYAKLNIGSKIELIRFLSRF